MNKKSTNENARSETQQRRQYYESKDDRNYLTW